MEVRIAMLPIHRFTRRNTRKKDENTHTTANHGAGVGKTHKDKSRRSVSMFHKPEKLALKLEVETQDERSVPPEDYPCKPRSPGHRELETENVDSQRNIDDAITRMYGPHQPQHRGRKPHRAETRREIEKETIRHGGGGYSQLWPYRNLQEKTSQRMMPKHQMLDNG